MPNLSSSWTKECFSANLSAQMWWLTCDKREIPCDFCLQCKLPFSTDFSRAMASFSRHCLWSFISAIRPETHWDTQIRMESYMTYIIVRQKYNSSQVFSDKCLSKDCVFLSENHHPLSFIRHLLKKHRLHPKFSGHKIPLCQQPYTYQIRFPEICRHWRGFGIFPVMALSVGPMLWVESST